MRVQRKKYFGSIFVQITTAGNDLACFQGSSNTRKRRRGRAAALVNVSEGVAATLV